MLKTKKSKIIFGIIIVLIIVVISVFIMAKPYVSLTKNTSDTLQSVENIMGQDIKDIQPLVDESISEYNKGNGEYIYNELFAKEVKENVPIEKSNQIFQIIQTMFGKCLSYDMDKSQISITKTMNKEVKYEVFIPATFEKLDSGTVKIFIKKDKLGESKIHLFKFDTASM